LADTADLYAAAAAVIERSAAAYVSGVPEDTADDGLFGPASVTWQVSTDLASATACTGGIADGMGGRVTDLIVIPDSFWLRPETTAALRDRDIGRLFALLRQYAGASQTQIAIACGMTQSKVSYIMRGIAQVEALAVFERIAYGLGLPDPARMLIGLAPGEPPGPAAPGRVQREAIRPGDDDLGLTAFPVAGLLDPYLVGEQEEAGPVRRRTFVGLTVTSMVSTMLDGLPHDHDPAGSDCFGAVLVGQPAGPAQEPDLKALAEAASSARRQYQACGYSELTRTLPQLLTDLDAASRSLDGAARSRALALCTDAYHVAAGLLLKLGDQGLAHLAADRSMRAARASGDPVTVGASARIVTHALMSGGHLAAVSTARSQAEDLDRDARTYTRSRCRCTARCFCAAPSRQPRTVTARPRTICSPKPTRPPSVSEPTRTTGGPRSVRSTPSCTG